MILILILRSHIGKAFVLLCIVAALLSCVSTIQAQVEDPARGGWSAANSVYRIECPDQNRAGTGFGHKSGRIITAEHVVRGCDAKLLKVIEATGAVTGVKSFVVDADHDLALLIPTVDHFVKVPFDIASESTFTMGAQVSTWGFPEGYGGSIPLLTVGYLAGVDKYEKNPNIIVRKWVVNGAFNRGNSGGPVLDTKTGKVCGVISSKLAPMPKDIQTNLQELQEKGSHEGQTTAKILTYLRNQIQLVIGFAALTIDLRKFLKDNGVEP